jgi:hypothetical protein
MHKKVKDLEFRNRNWNEDKTFVKELNKLTSAEREAVLEPFRRSMSELNVEVKEGKDQAAEGEK